jgi:hypothetical protein
VKRQWRVRWQRLGMSRAKVRVYETRKAAELFALKLQGRMAEAYPELDPEAYYCCPGTVSHECGCRGETWAEQWARESAQIPPLVLGPEIEARPVGEWGTVSLTVPDPVPADVVEAFERGGRRWPVPDGPWLMYGDRAEAAAEMVAGAMSPEPDDIPF